MSSNNIINKKNNSVELYFEFPDELWIIIKDFLIQHKKHHMLKMKSIFENEINGLYGPICERWTYFPPWPNSNDIILEERSPVPNKRNLLLVSICWNVKGTGGWWCGYGWVKRK
jgi:hypothetical protein